MSDTHGYHRELSVPEGDILVHAGDLTLGGSLDQVAELNEFLGGLPHRHKVVIAGNHDFCFEREEAARAQIHEGRGIERRGGTTFVNATKARIRPWLSS